MYKEPNLKINLIPIIFDKDTFAGCELPYVDEDHLRELRKSYRDSHVIKRSGNWIQCVSLNDETESLGKEKQFSIKNDFTLASRLIQDSIIRFLKAKNTIFSRLFNPTSVIMTKVNLMQGVVNDEIASVLPMYAEYQFDTRIIVPHNKRVTFGILLDFNMCQLVEPTVKELMDKGVDITGCYVVVDDSQEPEGVEPRFRRKLVGRVKDVAGHSLTPDVNNGHLIPLCRSSLLIELL
jgi:hypothetical protein